MTRDTVGSAAELSVLWRESFRYGLGRVDQHEAGAEVRTKSVGSASQPHKAGCWLRRFNGRRSPDDGIPARIAKGSRVDARCRQTTRKPRQEAASRAAAHARRNESGFDPLTRLLGV